VAFDFVVHPDGRRLIVEMSYGYVSSAVHGCAGYFDQTLRFVPGTVWPEDAIIDDLLSGAASKA
jgi:hypothetical protein